MTRRKALSSVLIVSLSACGTVAQVRTEIERTEPVARRQLEHPAKFVEVPRFAEVRGAKLPVTEVSSSSQGGSWLRDQHVTSFEIRNPTPLSEVLRSISSQGINISYDLPLDTIKYVGIVNATNAEAALRQILGSSGLDYVVDDGRKLVIVKPLASRTWYVNIGRRTTSYASSGQMQGGQSSVDGGGSSGVASAQTVSGSSNTTAASTNSNQAANGQSAGGGASAVQSSSTFSASTAGTGITNSEDFWSGLDKELTNRLNVPYPVQRAGNVAQAGNPNVVTGFPLPSPNIAAMQQPPLMSGIADAGQAELYVRKKIGHYALNPDTGAITVTAPYWILNDLDAYIKRVQRTYNAELVFEGEMVLVTGTRSDSEGIDLQALARWANGRYGAIVSNNALGGITLSFPNGNIPTVAAGTQQVGGALLGISSRADGIQIFNDYLSELGRYTVKERPAVTTTHGVPGTFNTLAPRYYNTVTQNAVTGNTGSAVQATTNQLQSKEFGTRLTVNPQINIGTELVRALIDLKSVIYAGDQAVPQIVSTGSSVQTVINKIPLEKRFNISGEALLRDGDLIIVGGQVADTMQTDENGLPGGAAPISGLFGTKKSETSGGTYYFALKVAVKNR